VRKATVNAFLGDFRKEGGDTIYSVSSFEERGGPTDSAVLEVRQDASLEELTKLLRAEMALTNTTVRPYAIVTSSLSGEEMVRLLHTDSVLAGVLRHAKDLTLICVEAPLGMRLPPTVSMRAPASEVRAAAEYITAKLNDGGDGKRKAKAKSKGKRKVPRKTFMQHVLHMKTLTKGLKWLDEASGKAYLKVTNANGQEIEKQVSCRTISHTAESIFDVCACVYTARRTAQTGRSTSPAQPTRGVARRSSESSG
jgi:hypothetical protein